MTTPFIRTVRSLDSDHPTAQIFGLVLAVALLSMWIGWFLLARVSLYESSATAGLQAEYEAHPVDASVAGRVTRAALVAGRDVKAGEVLVELDAEAEALEVAIERRHVLGLNEMSSSLRAQIAGARRSWVAAREAQATVIAEAKSRHEQAESSTVFVHKQLERVARLESSGSATQEELERAKSEADNRRSIADVARLTVERLAAEQRVQFEDRGAALRALISRAAELDAQIDGAQNRLQRLEREIQLRRIVAPIDGRLGEIVPLQPGSFVRDGQRLTTVVPRGLVRVVGFFPAAVAMGRLKPGQRAQLRLTALPWPEHRPIPARVTRVSAEPANGTIRVELNLDNAAGRTEYLEHGMTGRVDVEVDRIAPAALLLRKIGMSQPNLGNR